MALPIWAELAIMILGSRRKGQKILQRFAETRGNLDDLRMAFRVIEARAALIRAPNATTPNPEFTDGEILALDVFREQFDRLLDKIKR